MAKRRREQDRDGVAAETAELNAVFVDTSLGTHLAILVCSSDTASDFKKKVTVEHKQCFPEIGEIQVHSVKAKRMSNYYHLPDIMLVWSVFHGVKGNWFLSVDASNTPTCLSIRSSLEFGTSSGVRTGMTDMDYDCRGLISDANKNEIFPSALPDCAAEKKAVSEMIAKPKVDKPEEKATESHRGIYAEEHSMGTESPVKKKRKVRYTKDVCRNFGLEVGNAMSHPNGKDMKPNMSDSIVKVSGARNDQSDVDGKLLSEGTYLPNMAEKGNLGSILDSQNLNGSDRRKEENGFESVMENGLGEGVHPLGIVSIMVPGSSAGMMDASGGGKDVNTPGKKKKKRKAKKIAENIQDTTDMEQIGNGERIEHSTDKMEEGMGLSLEHDHDVLMPSNSKAPGHVGPDLALKEARLLQDAEKSNSSIGNSHKLLDSDERNKDDALESKIDYKLGQDVPTVHSGGICTAKISDLSATLMDAGGGTGDANSDGKKRKKKKVHKTAKIQVTGDVEQIGISEMKKPHTETISSEEKGASLERDNEVIMPADSKAPDHVIPDLALEEASIMQDANAGMEPEISSGGGEDVNTPGKKRKKRKAKKIAENIQDTTYMEQIGNSERIKHITDKMEEGMGLSLEHDHDVLMPSSSKAPGHVGPDLALKEASLLQDAEKSNSSIGNSHKLLDSDEKNKDDALESKIYYKLGQDVPTVHSGGLCTANISDLSATLMDAAGGTGDANSDGKKRKKKKVHKAAKVQVTGDVEQIGISEMKKPHTETIRMEEKGASLGRDNEVIMSADSKARDHVNPDLALEEATIMQDANAGMEPEISSGRGEDVNTPGKKRKKSKAKKIAENIQDTTDMEQIGNGERIKHSTDKMEEGMGLSLEHDHDVLTPSNSKAPGHVGPDLALKEASLLQDAEKSNSSIRNSRKLLDSDERNKDDALESKIDYKLGQDVPTAHSGGICTANISDLSATLMDAGSGTGDANSDGKKRKKKKVHKTAKVQVTVDVEQIGISEMKKTHTETIRLEEKGASLERDNEVIMPADSTTPDHVNPDLALEEASIMQDANAGIEPDISSCIKKMKKKKREKKPVGTSLEHPGIKEIHNGIGGSLDLPSQSGEYITKGTGKEESTRLNEGMGVEMRLLDASNHDAQENVLGVNRKEADLVEMQAEQTSEEVIIRNKMMTEKTKSFRGVSYAASPTADTENTIMESNEVDRDNENTENKSIKAIKKRKKKKLTATNVQENLPVKDQQVGIDPLAMKKTSIAFANSEQEGKNIDSSQVVSHKTEEMVDENHELVLNTDGLKENTEKGSEGINFKQNFVANQLQDQVDFSNKVRKATKLKRSSTKAKDNDLPSFNISTELNSIKFFKNKKIDNNSHGEDTVTAVRDSASKTDWDEMSPNSLKRSPEAAEKGVKISSPSELCEMSRQKPNDIVAPSSFQNKNPSLDKSSSERSKSLNYNRGKERLLLGQNVTNVMPMKTPKKKILLTNSGAIFQDNSGESSGDENGTMHSDDSTLSPSDSSSMSVDSGGESEVSQNSTSNGANNAKGKSLSKLEEDLTMDVILRSSKRFKKAKELASQSETQPIELVPDSLPVP